MRELLTYSNGGGIEEKITLRIRADDEGDIYVPVAGYGPDGNQNCKYSWEVKVDGGNVVDYSGVGSNNGKIRVGYGLIPLSVHTVIVKPKIDDYGWLRAFGYKGTDCASSLINIVSDKSYKGYGLSEQYSGDYYKAYQYFGCINLANTDEELLPDTLEVIGNKYRYYEYAGCVNLVNNADEKILKTVRVIGDDYRAYQYQNCNNISKIRMRAINRASVGNNYRYNQYSGIATDKKPANIYIEGGIEEGGDWGLSDTRVKNIYVYEGLVSDYQTKLSGITSAKIKKNPEWDNMEYEFIEIKAIADSSGKIRIPVGGFSTSMVQNCEYDRYVSIDGGEAVEISGTGSAGYVSVGSGLTNGSEHRVVIKPKTIGWGWGRAFGYFSTGAQTYIKEIVHDSYKCFAVGRLDTGAHYKHSTFMGCTNLINSYEKLPTSVTTVGDYYMKECYTGCTSLTEAFWEVMHRGATIGIDYRKSEYGGCTALSLHKGMAGYLGGTYPNGYKDNYLAGAGNSLTLNITRLESMYTIDFASSNYYSGGTMTLATITRAGRYIFSGNLQGTSSNTWFDIQIWQNSTKIYSDTAPDPGTKALKVEMNCAVGDVIQIRKGTEQRYGNINTMKLEYSNVMGLVDSRVGIVNVYVDNLYTYKTSNSWSDIDSNKFGVYYYDYQPIPAVDISKYTTLVGSYDMLSSFDISGSNRLQPTYTVGRYIGLAVAGEEENKLYIPGMRINLNNGAVYGALIKIRLEDGVMKYDGSYIHTGGVSGRYDGTVNGAYSDEKGNILYADGDSDYSGGGHTDYKELGGRTSTEIQGSFSGWTSGVCAGRDGRTVVWEGRTYYTNNRWGTGINQIGTYTGSYTGIDFSDDGMVAYLQESLGMIKQYNLSAPWNLGSVRTDTGKSLNISGYFSISKDKKYLYVLDGSLKVYQYTP